MSAKDYKICPALFNAYIAKVSKRNPNMMLEDISDEDCIKEGNGCSLAKSMHSAKKDKHTTKKHTVMEKTATRHQEKKQGGLAYAAKAVVAFTLITTGTMLLLASCGDSDLPLGQHIATAFGLLAASAACFAGVAFTPLKSIFKD